jgi:hypothetical protein
MAEMLSDSTVIRPAAPSFHSTHERKAREKGSKPREQESVQPITAALRHDPFNRLALGNVHHPIISRVSGDFDVASRSFWYASTAVQLVNLLNCGIVHKSKKYLFVLVHALDEELLQQILEHQLEFVAPRGHRER